MNSTRRTIALVLLATFVAGGFVAPALHEGKHALDQRSEAEAASLAHAAHTHGPEAEFEEALDFGPEHVLCLLCHHQWSSVIPDRSAPSIGTEVRLLPGTAQASPLVVREGLPIRGPPAAA